MGKGCVFFLYDAKPNSRSSIHHRLPAVSSQFRVSTARHDVFVGDLCKEQGFWELHCKASPSLRSSVAHYSLSLVRANRYEMEQQQITAARCTDPLAECFVGGAVLQAAMRISSELQPCLCLDCTLCLLNRRKVYKKRSQSQAPQMSRISESSTCRRVFQHSAVQLTVVVGGGGSARRGEGSAAVQTKQTDSEGRRTQRARVWEGESQFTLRG